MRSEWLVLPRAAAIWVLLGATAASTASAGPAADFIQLLAGHAQYDEVQISPSGQWLAWVQPVADSRKPSALGSAVFVARATGDTKPRQVSASTDPSRIPATLREEAVAWSPDGQWLAFLSDAAVPGQKQLYVWPVSGGNPRKLTSVRGELNTVRWSPDGRSVAMLYTENATREAGPLAAVAAPTGVIDEQVLEQRLTVVDVGSGAVRQVSPPDLYVYEYDWSPDSTTFVATAAHGPGDNNWYVAQLLTFDVATGSSRTIARPATQVAVPRWSPDGRQIAFIAGLSSDEPIASGEVQVVPAAGGEVHTVTPGLAGSAYWLSWGPGRGELLIAEALNGGSAFAAVDVRTGKVRTLWQGAETARGPAGYARGISLASRGRTTAVIRESFNAPPAIWIGEIGRWKQLLAPAAATDAPWGAAENVKWHSDEFQVQGWLVPPAHVEAGHKYPMVVWIHGGPAWLTAPSWPSPLDGRILLLAQRGYYVFFPNPRGSAGYGEQFKRANVKDFGGGDLRDILAGIRQVVATHPVDDTRVGLTGWSYGGYMTMWALTQTDRFRAAVVGAGLANWQSYYGENGIDEWMIPYFGASVYDDPVVYAKSSPMNFIKRVHTPTLLIVGDGDIECPPPQSYEYWHALKTLGVDTQLVVYPHEGHVFQDPEHISDMLQRLLDWFDTRMPAGARPAAQ